MKRVWPRYGPYLLWWCGVWLLLTVPTQIPELYERSLVSAHWDHTGVFNGMVRAMEYRSLLEVPCGLIWGSLSWLLQRGIFSELSRSPLVAVIVTALAEAMLLGLPLACLNPGVVNIWSAVSDARYVPFSSRSLLIESAGVLLAFPLACLATGYFAIDRRKQGAQDEARPDHVWSPAPRRPLR